jgi:hypothetical protein
VAKNVESISDIDNRYIYNNLTSEGSTNF